MLVIPQSRPVGCSPSARILTVDHGGRGVPLALLAGTPDHLLRAKFPSLAQALDYFAKAGGAKFGLKITWAGYEGLNFHQELQGAALVKGIAFAFDRFLKEAARFPGQPPAANLRPTQFKLQDLTLTGIVTFSGNILQAEVQLAG